MMAQPNTIPHFKGPEGVYYDPKENAIILLEDRSLRVAKHNNLDYLVYCYNVQCPDIGFVRKNRRVVVEEFDKNKVFLGEL